MGNWVELSDIQKVVEESRINQVQASYIMALLITFDDIMSRSEGNVAIRYVPHRERFGELL